MAFKLKSGNKPKFKEVGSSPLKHPDAGGSEGLADANIDYTRDTPAEGVLSGMTSELQDDKFYAAITPQVTSKDDVDEDKVTEALQKIQPPQPTGEDYKSRKERRADKQLMKEKARADDGKIDPEERRDIKITKLYGKEKEQRSKGDMGYDFSFREGLTYGPKAEATKKKLADQQKKKEEAPRVAYQKLRTKKMKEERKTKEKAEKEAGKAKRKEDREAKRTQRKEGRATRKAERQAKRSAKKGK